MKSANIIAVFVLFNALLSTDASSSRAAQAKDSRGQRGSHQEAAPMSSKGSTYGNHQWSADPERGWVRGDESHGPNDQRSTTKRRGPSKAQQNEKGKKL